MEFWTRTADGADGSLACTVHPHVIKGSLFKAAVGCSHLLAVSLRPGVGETQYAAVPACEPLRTLLLLVCASWLSVGCLG